MGDTSHWVPVAKLRPLLAKLESPLASVRKAALESVLFKLEHGLVVPAHLVHEASLPRALLTWFNAEDVPLPRAVLDLMLRLVDSHPAVFGGNLLAAGAAAFLTALIRDLPEFCVPSANALLDALFSIEPAVLLEQENTGPANNVLLTAEAASQLPGAKAYAELLTALRPRAQLADEDAMFADAMDAELKALEHGDVDALLAVGNRLCVDAPDILLEALYEFESQIVYEFPPQAVLAAGTPLQGLISLLLNTEYTEDASPVHGMEALALRALSLWFTRMNDAVTVGKAIASHSLVFSPPLLAVLHNTLVRFLKRALPLLRAAQLHGPIFEALDPCLALYRMCLALSEHTSSTSIEAQSSGALAVATQLGKLLASHDAHPAMAALAVKLLDAWAPLELGSLGPVFDAAAVDVALDAELGAPVAGFKTRLADYVLAHAVPETGAAIEAHAKVLDGAQVLYALDELLAGSPSVSSAQPLAHWLTAAGTTGPALADAVVTLVDTRNNLELVGRVVAGLAPSMIAAYDEPDARHLTDSVQTVLLATLGTHSTACPELAAQVLDSLVDCAVLEGMRDAVFCQRVLDVVILGCLDGPERVAQSASRLLVALSTQAPAGELELSLLLRYVPWLQVGLDNPNVSGDVAGVLNLLTRAMDDAQALVSNARLVFHTGDWVRDHATQELRSHVVDGAARPPFEVLPPAAHPCDGLVAQDFVLPLASAGVGAAAHAPLTAKDKERAGDLFEMAMGSASEFEPGVVDSAAVALLALLRRSPVVVKTLIQGHGGATALTALVKATERSRPEQASVLLWILAFALAYQPELGSSLVSDATGAMGTLVAWMFASDPRARAAAVYVVAAVTLGDTTVPGVGAERATGTSLLDSLVPSFGVTVYGPLLHGFALPFEVARVPLGFAQQTQVDPLVGRLVCDALNGLRTNGSTALSTTPAWSVCAAWDAAWATLGTASASGHSVMDALQTVLSQLRWRTDADAALAVVGWTGVLLPRLDGVLAAGPHTSSVPDMVAAAQILEVIVACVEVAKAGGVTVDGLVREVSELVQWVPSLVGTLWARPEQRVPVSAAARDEPAGEASLHAARAVHASVRVLNALVSGPELWVAHCVLSGWTLATWNAIASGCMAHLLASCGDGADRVVHESVVRVAGAAMLHILAVAPDRLGAAANAAPASEHEMGGWICGLVEPHAPMSITTVGLNSECMYSKRAQLVNRLFVLEALLRRARRHVPEGLSGPRSMSDRALTLLTACLGGLVHDPVGEIQAGAWGALTALLGAGARTAHAVAQAHPRILVTAFDAVRNTRGSFLSRTRALEAVASVLEASGRDLELAAALLPDGTMSALAVCELYGVFEVVTGVLSEPAAPPVFLEAILRLVATLVAVEDAPDQSVVATFALHHGLWPALLELLEARSYVERTKAGAEALGLATGGSSASEAAWVEAQTWAAVGESAKFVHRAQAHVVAIVHALAYASREQVNYFVNALPLVPALAGALAGPACLSVDGRSQELASSLKAFVESRSGSDAVHAPSAVAAEDVFVGAAARLLGYVWQALSAGSRATLWRDSGDALMLAFAFHTSDGARSSVQARVDVAHAAAAVLEDVSKRQRGTDGIVDELDQEIQADSVAAFWRPEALHVQWTTVLPGALLGAHLLALYRELHTPDLVYTWSVPNALTGMARLERARSDVASALCVLWLSSQSAVELACLTEEMARLRREVSEALALVVKLNGKAESGSSGSPGLDSMSRSLALAQVFNSVSLLKAAVLKNEAASAQCVASGIFRFAVRALGRVTSASKWPSWCGAGAELAESILGLVTNVCAESEGSLRALAGEPKLVEWIVGAASGGEAIEVCGRVARVAMLTLGEVSRGPEVRGLLIKARVHDAMAAATAGACSALVRGEGGSSGRATERAEALLRFWVMFTSTSEGQERATHTRGLFRAVFEVAAGKRVAWSTARVSACLVLRNMAHCSESRVHFLEDGRMKQLLDGAFAMPRDVTGFEGGVEAVVGGWAAITDALWVLLYHSQKIKVALRRNGGAKTLAELDAYIWHVFGNALNEATPSLAQAKAAALSSVAWYTSLDTVPAPLLSATAVEHLVNVVEALAVVQDLLQLTPL